MGKLKRRADGRYQKTIVDKRTGKKVYFYGKTEKEINQKVLAYSDKQENGASFSEVACNWWDEANEKLAYQSTKTYKPALKRAIEHFLNTPIKKITTKDITVFLTNLAKQGYAQRTVQNQKLICKLIFDFAINENNIDYNPCSYAKLPKAAPTKKRAAASSHDEEIIKKSYDIWLFPFIAIMTGMRKGEILALQWQDINFDENLIYITKSVFHKGDKPFIKEPKTTAGFRSIPLLAPLKKVFNNIKNRKSTDYIISDDGTKPLTNRRFITLYNNFKKQTNISCTAHQLRHTFATTAFECGVPIKAIQEILGHTQISTTLDIYTDFRKESLKHATDLLNEKMS
ncbi:MAG: site-specific integrase [Clostridia bacterium]|nr:site-specific integrase [Clostridia bacterium]